jgi:hypothetical protein
MLDEFSDIVAEEDAQFLSVAARVAESSQHIHQQLQADICPACKCAGVDTVQDIALTKVCRICGGTGKRSAVYQTL